MADLLPQPDCCETTEELATYWRAYASAVERDRNQLRAQVERAADIIDGLLAFDLGSAERAVNFLAERDGSHPFSSTVGAPE
jgi:hypothetical protein